MVYDSKRQKMVVFGGQQGLVRQAFLGDTWEWDASALAWTYGTPTSSNSAPGAAPSARSGHAMVYDSQRGKVILFGGGINSDSMSFGLVPILDPLNDLWEWDGTTGEWTKRPPFQLRNILALFFERAYGL